MGDLRGKGKDLAGEPRAGAGARLVVSDRVRVRERERKGEEYRHADEDQTS
jgi:hypothetical protein